MLPVPRPVVTLLDSSLDPVCSLPSYFFGERGFWSTTNAKDLLLCLCPGGVVNSGRCLIIKEMELAGTRLM